MDAALRRIYRWMGAFAAAGSLALLAWKGPWHGGGFALGAALSIVSFHWMKGAVDALAGFSQRRGRVVARFLLRYALIAAAGYVIFRTSLLSLSAFLAGLCVFAAGVLAEMIYELAAGTGARSGTQS